MLVAVDGKNLILASVALLLMLVPTRVDAQDGDQLVVGVYHAPPFAIEGDAAWDGISVHLWRRVAQELDLQFEWRKIEPGRIAGALSDGSVDVVIGPAASAESEGEIDYTHSHHVSSVAYADNSQRSLRAIIAAVLSPRFWKLAMWLAVAWLIVGAVAWLFERSSNEEEFGGAWKGVWSGFWWAAVTMSTIGYGDKSPRSVGGRIVAMFWMLVAVAITAVITASLTSVLVRGGSGSVDFPSDLSRMRVGTVGGSPAAELLSSERISFQTFEEPSAGLEAVRRDSIDVFVHDGASLRYLERSSKDIALRVRETGFAPQHHTFALPQNSPLREPLNRVILDHIEEPTWQNIVERYVASSSNRGR